MKVDATVLRERDVNFDLYTRRSRYPDLHAKYCAAGRCDTRALHDHFKNEGRTDKRRWGCGSRPTFEERLERFEAPNPASGEGRRPIMLRDLRNRHAGEDVYLVASGKSLDYIDDSFFHGRVTVGINNVWRRFKDLSYLVRKEFNPSGFRTVLDQAGPNTTHIVTRGSYGILNDHSEKLVRRHFRSALNAGRIVIAPHSQNTATRGHMIVELPRGDQLITSDSTITTGIHLAAYLGARSIILCGHDQGLLDDEANFKGYHDRESLGMVWNQKVKTKRGILSGQAAYNAWLGGGIDSINITRDTLILRDLLQERYPGLLVYSLSPFIGLGLEGHKFTHARI